MGANESRPSGHVLLFGGVPSKAAGGWVRRRPRGNYYKGNNGKDGNKKSAVRALSVET
ncbi:hypothetical protein MMC12_006871 [Toensbergia leucococca]|nr:hypothetical protein [Toensbergia leucococca]